MNRLSQVVPRALLLFALGASVVPAGAQVPAPVSKDPGTVAEADLGQPPTDLSPQVFYEYLLAEIAGARGQFGVAVPAYLDLARRTRDPRIARRATEMALFAHDLPAALEAARIWSEAEPDSVEAKRVLAGLLVSGGGGRLAEAQAHLARVLADAGERLPQTLLGLNRAFAQVQDKAAVRSTIDRVTEPYLQLPEAHFARAQAAYAAQDEDAARHELDQALVLRPDWEPAVLFQAQLLQTRSAGEARLFLADFLARHPDSQLGRVAYARALAGDRQYEAALVEFRRLLAERPDDPELINATALLAVQADQLDEADRLFRQLLTLSRDPDGVRLSLGQLAERRKRYDEAIEWYRGVTDEARKPEAQLRIAQALAAAGRLDEARKYLRALPGDAATVARYRLAEAQLLSEANRTKEAFEVVEQALRAQPDDPDLLYESAMLAERMGRLTVMESRLRKLIALKPDSSQAYNALGYALADRGQRLPEAEALIRKALALAPEDPFITDSMGWVLFRRGDTPGAAVQLEKAYRLRQDPEIAAHLGEVYWRMGRQDEARRLWAESLKDNPDNKVLKAVVKRLAP
jgi:tetratricopeptide (TPR) repeat protein